MRHAWGLLLCSGCILPVSTGAPMPATTLGKGHIGFAISGEAPTLDLISDNGDTNQTGSTSAVNYGAAPAAAMTVSLGYGIADNTDLEVAAEGALYFFFFPIPLGGSIGIRQHVQSGDTVDVAIAAKVGYVSSDAELDGDTSAARAQYASFQAVVQGKNGTFRPLAAVNIMPARIHRDPYDEGPFDFNGVASSITLGAMFVGDRVTAGPYLAVTNFYSDRFDNSGFFFSGGLMFAVRPDRNRKPAPVITQPLYGPAPPPGGYYPQPYAPPMQPQPQPAPMPPPQPAPPAQPAPPPPPPTQTP